MMLTVLQQNALIDAYKFYGVLDNTALRYNTRVVNALIEKDLLVETSHRMYKLTDKGYEALKSIY